MPYCPECRREYREGFAICSDCGCELVQYLEDDVSDESHESQSDSPSSEWITLARFTSQQYAELVLQGLKAKGIPAVILNHGGFHGRLELIAFSAGAYALMVPPEHVYDANKEGETILGDIWEDSRVHGVE